MKNMASIRSRALALGLCLTLLLTEQAPLAAAEAAGTVGAASGPVQYGVRVADPSTMDGYLNDMLNETNGSRYAGRVWSDKTVFAYGAAQDKGGLADNVLVLDEDTDGYNGRLGFDADFLNVYSALASSQVVNDNLSAPFDLVLVVDMSGSMAQSTKYAVNTDERNGYQETMQERIENSRIQKLLDAVNETIDTLMAQNAENRVSVCVYGANAAVLMPLAHYQRFNGQPYLTIGGMETLYDRDDFDTVEELSQQNPGMTFDEGLWTINRDACYTLVADALYDQSYAAPETYTQHWNRTISNNVKSDLLHPDPDLNKDGKQLLADQYVGYMTNTQGGIYLGMKQLADTAEMTFTEKLANEETAIVARVPAVMILTDGGANFAFNSLEEDALHALPQNTGDEWYDIYLPQEDITNLYNEGLPQSKLTSIPAYDDPGIFYDSDMDVGGTPSTILEVLMTASYMKTVVEKHYEQGWKQGQASESSRIPLRIFTVSVDAVHLPAWGRYRIYPTMDPEEYFNATRWSDANYASIGSDFRAPLPWREIQDIQMEDLLPYTFGKWEEWKALSSPDETISLLADWIGNSGSRGFERVQLDDDPNHVVPGCATLKIGLLPEDHVYTREDADGLSLEEISVTNQEVIDHIFYPDQFYDVESQELANVFREVVDMLVDSIFVPVSGTNGAGAEDSVTYRDPIGAYMQVKRDAIILPASDENAADQRFDMAALLFGEMHGLTRTAVYDGDFNEAYTENHGGIVDDFQEGWYRGDDPATAAYRDPDDSPEESWSSGWTYRIGYRTLIDYVPTLQGVEDLSGAQGHKVYTLYRFVESQTERNLLRINSVYGEDVPISLSNLWDDLDEKPADNGLYKDTLGVYRLSDIRVWTELDDEKQETLCVDIPAAALPTQTAEISYNTSGSMNFERNWQDKKQSTPFRLFYAVGVDDALIDRDEDGRRSWVDIESLPQDYVTNHQGDGFGSVYFLTGAEQDAAGAKETTDHAGGSSTITFTPDEENSYYRYQAALPLHTHAYRVTNTSPLSGAGLASVDNRDGWTEQSAQTSNSRTLWEDGRTGGALWAGGVYMGTYRDEKAYTAARRALETVDGVAMIRDGSNRLYPFQEGGIVFFERDLLSFENVPDVQRGEIAFHPEDYYFVVTEYYVPDGENGRTGRAVQLVSCDKGSDLAAGGNEAITEKLCWVDDSGSVDVTFDYVAEGDATHGAPTLEKLTYLYFGLKSYLSRVGVAEEKLEATTASWLEIQEQLTVMLDVDANNLVSREEYEAAGFRWALAVKSGGRRMGEVSKSGVAKTRNTTQTASHSFTPAFDISGSTGETLIINSNLGNSGKLTVNNASLCVTNKTDGQDAAQFPYQIYAEGLSGAHEAVVLKYDPLQNNGNGEWRQQIAALDVKTNEAGLLLAADGQLAAVDADGEKVFADETAGKPYYYMYIAPDDGEAGQRRIFNGEAGDQDAACRNMGRHIYRAGKLPENSMEADAYWTTYSAPTAEAPSGTTVFYCRDAWLIPAGQVDGRTAWRFDPNNTTSYAHIYAEGANDQPLVIARLEPGEDTAVKVTSDYLINVTYQTKTLYFGSRAQEDGAGRTALSVDDLFDTTPFWLDESTCVAIPGQQRAVMETAEYTRAQQTARGVIWLSWEEIANHTAEFTLGSDEGLMLSVRPGQSYRVTEKGLEAEGYLLQEAVQEHGAEGRRYTLNEANDPSGAVMLNAWEDLSSGDAGAHRNCGRFPDGPDEYDGGKAIRHWIVYDTLQMDDRSSELMALLLTARFTSLQDGSHTYSLYGRTDELLESVQYVNESMPSALIISNWLEPSGSNVHLTKEDGDQSFVYKLSLTNGNQQPLQEPLSYVVTGIKDGKRITLRSGALPSGNGTAADSLTGQENAWTFILQGGQRMAISGLPQSYAYTLTQEAVSNFTASVLPSGARNEDRSVTVRSTVKAADSTPELVTYTNRKTTHDIVTSDEALDFRMWGVLAAAILLNVVITLVYLIRKRKHRHLR